MNKALLLLSLLVLGALAATEGDNSAAIEEQSTDVDSTSLIEEQQQIELSEAEASEMPEIESSEAESSEAEASEMPEIESSEAETSDIAEVESSDSESSSQEHDLEDSDSEDKRPSRLQKIHRSIAALKRRHASLSTSRKQQRARLSKSIKKNRFHRSRAATAKRSHQKYTASAGRHRRRLAAIRKALTRATALVIKLRAQLKGSTAAYRSALRRAGLHGRALRRHRAASRRHGKNARAARASLRRLSKTMRGIRARSGRLGRLALAIRRQNAARAFLRRLRLKGMKCIRGPVCRRRRACRKRGGRRVCRRVGPYLCRCRLSGGNKAAKRAKRSSRKVKGKAKALKAAVAKMTKKPSAKNNCETFNQCKIKRVCKLTKVPYKCKTQMRRGKPYAKRCSSRVKSTCKQLKKPVCRRITKCAKSARGFKVLAARLKQFRKTLASFRKANSWKLRSKTRSLYWKIVGRQAYYKYQRVKTQRKTICTRRKHCHYTGGYCYRKRTGSKCRRVRITWGRWRRRCRAIYKRVCRPLRQKCGGMRRNCYRYKQTVQRSLF